MYQNEFENLNLLMLEERILTPNEVADTEPEIFRRRIMGIISKAQHRLKFAGISNVARSALLSIILDGVNALKAKSHKALIAYYNGSYRNAINEATQSDYVKARDFNYVDSPDMPVAIMETQMNEEIETLSSFEENFSLGGLGGTEVKGLAEFESPYTKIALAVLAVYAIYHFMMKKKV